MAYVITLYGNTPPPLVDGHKFVSLAVDEAASSEGPWTEIFADVLVPLDSDPASPAARDVTVGASSPTVWLRIRFIDDLGRIAQTEPMYTGGSPTLATPADVRRVMGLSNTAVDDETLNHWLQVAESFLLPSMQEFGSQGTQVEYNVRGNQVIWMTTRGAVPTAVRTYTTNDSSAYPLTTLYGYHVDPRTGTVRLGGDSTLTYDRVEIDYRYAAGVPAAVRDGIAFTAASLFAQAPKLYSGLRSETIGDYSYTLSDKDIEDIVPAKAKALLRPFRRNQKRPFVV